MWGLDASVVYCKLKLGLDIMKGNNSGHITWLVLSYGAAHSSPVSSFENNGCEIKDRSKIPKKPPLAWIGCQESSS